MQRSQETTTREAYARHAAVACDLHLLPLPNCQRTNRNQSTAPKTLTVELAIPTDTSESLTTLFLLTGSRCTQDKTIGAATLTQARNGPGLIDLTPYRSIY